MSPPLLLIALIGAHFICDYPLQGQFLSETKNRSKLTPGVPWYQAMGAHVVIHGAAVALITGIWWLFFLEAGIHLITDDSKCTQKISFNTDQTIHLTCKLLWWLITLLIFYP